MCKAVLSVSGFLDAGGFLMFRKEYSVKASGSVSVLRLKWGGYAEMGPKKRAIQSLDLSIVWNILFIIEYGIVQIVKKAANPGIRLWQ